jgi:hypothetical protein
MTSQGFFSPASAKVNVNVIPFHLYRKDPQGILGKLVAGTGLKVEAITVALAGKMLCVLDQCAGERRSLVGTLRFTGIDNSLGVDEKHSLAIYGNKLLPPEGNIGNLRSIFHS